jgi:predicted phosphodiesterase
MRLAIIADIHANLEALQAVLGATRSRVDAYLCLGDLVDYGANPNECIELLAGVPLLAVVRGNHDSAVLDGDVSRFRTSHGRHSVRWTAARLDAAARAFLSASLPSYRSAELGLAAFHGGPLDLEWQYLYPSTDPATLRASLAGVAEPLLFVGHSHVAFRFAFERWTLVNPGSVGQPRNGRPAAHYAICDTASREVTLERVAYDIGAAAAKIRSAGLDLFLARRLYLGI